MTVTLGEEEYADESISRMLRSLRQAFTLLED
jgi:hypothetical protein